MKVIHSNSPGMKNIMCFYYLWRIYGSKCDGGPILLSALSWPHHSTPASRDRIEAQGAEELPVLAETNLPHSTRYMRNFSTGAPRKASSVCFLQVQQEGRSFCFAVHFGVFYAPLPLFFGLFKLSTNVWRLAHLRRCRQIKM